MTTKTEITEQSGPLSKSRITNEDIAKALGWVFYENKQPVDFVIRFAVPSHWRVSENEALGEDELPDFTNDLNAAWKYVWPEIVKLHMLNDPPPCPDGIKLSLLLYKAYKEDNPALYLCEKFMELRNAS